MKEDAELKELEELFGIPSFEDNEIYFPMFVAENSIEKGNGYILMLYMK